MGKMTRGAEEMGGGEVGGGYMVEVRGRMGGEVGMDGRYVGRWVSGSR